MSILLLAAALAAGGASAPDLLVVVNKSDDTVSILDAKSGVLRATVKTGRGPHEVEVLADGKIAAVSDYGKAGDPGHTVTLVDLDRGLAVGTVELGERTRPHGLEALADGRLLVTAEGTRELLVVDPKKRRVTARIPTGREVSHMVAAPRDGVAAYVASIGSGTVSAAHLASAKISKDLATGAGAEGIDVTPNGREVWVTNRDANTVTVVDAGKLEVLATIPAAKFPIRVKITPDGRRALVSCAQSGDVAVFDVASRTQVRRIPMDREAVPGSEARVFSDRFGKSPVPVGLLIAPDGKRAWVASTNADVVSVIDLERLEVVGRLTAGKEPDGLAGRFSR
ncbi:MAG: beta-propeller fold lactonase family protein [Acidobacteriota bacterium]|nr:beta-propeller fold lactonase family protein [Acidobacteriota bacterium]MDQ5872869.1 beta-propeller fold lactonase family protein [Acidobacteriota bacterium]